ncbi:MAG: hypothetical protein Q7I97_09430 [Thermovirgaceae bacterium]|nr:hypothetical protein [Thermovirgaceae bacterium]
MNQPLINAFMPSKGILAKAKRMLPGAAATTLLWLLAATCGEPGVIEAAFPLLFLPLISITSFLMARNRAGSLLDKRGAKTAVRTLGNTAVAVAAESIPFVVLFSDWSLNWSPFAIGVLLAVAIGGLAGTVTELLFPGENVQAACLAAFLQAPSITGLALIRHPSLLLLPNQGPLDMLDGAFGPLWGVDLMLPLLAGSAWIGLGVYAAVAALRKTPSARKL